MKTEKNPTGLDKKLPLIINSNIQVSGLIYENVRATLRRAVNRTVPRVHKQVHDISIRNIFAAIPAILMDDNFYSSAERVLAGHKEAKREFASRLYANFGSVLSSGKLSTNKDSKLSKAQEKPNRYNAPIFAQTVSSHRLAIIETAIRRIYQGSGDPNRFINSYMFRIVSSLARLTHLHKSATSSLSNDSNPESFLTDLREFGGFTGWDPSQPFPPDNFGEPRPLPFGPGWEDGFPGPDDDHRDPGNPFTIPFAPGRHDGDCIAEIADALSSLGASPADFDYRIDSIESMNECPDERITIRGSGFRNISSDLSVRFRSAVSGTPIVVEPISVSDTHIIVVVPEMATCGDLEIGLAEPIVIRACGSSAIFDLNPTTDVRFLGGRTRITALTLESDAHCFADGEEIAFFVGTCNTTSVRVTAHLSGYSSVVFFEETYEGDLPNRISFSAPELPVNSVIQINCTVTGPCGTDNRELTLRIARHRAFDETEWTEFTTREFKNWNENIQKSSLLQSVPASLDEIVNAVRTVDAMVSQDGIDRRICVSGSAFSFTNCMAPTTAENYYLIDTCALNAVIAPLEGSALRTILGSTLRDDIESVLSYSNLQDYEEVIGTVSPVGNRLVHVEAGIKLKSLTHALKGMGMTLPTIGGGNQQSLMGVLATGSHGSTTRLPPIADFVRAIHLVGPGGQQWWIERETSPVTDPEAMETLRGDLLDACIKIERSDTLFNAALMSFGATGIVYSLVYEVIDDHHMRRTTYGADWNDGKRFIQDRILDPDQPLDWFAELLVYPDWNDPHRTWDVRISTANLTDEPLTPCKDPEDDDGLSDGAIAFFAGIGATTGWAAIFGAWLARETFMMSVYFGTFQWHKFRRVKRIIRTARQLYHAIVGTYDAIIHHFDEEVMYERLPDMLNAIYEMGFIVPVGRNIVQAIQQHITLDQREDRDDVLISDLALRSADIPICGAEDTPPEVTCPTPFNGHLSPGFDRLVESYEYVLPASDVADFVDALAAAANNIRIGFPGHHDGEALLVTFPIRFTQPSNAYLAMQKTSHGISAHVEVWTMERLNGTEEFLRRARQIARDFGAIPHWGQLHDETRNFRSLYGWKLNAWQRAIANFYDESPGYQNIFRNEFCTDRGLL